MKIWSSIEIATAENMWIKKGVNVEIALLRFDVLLLEKNICVILNKGCAYFWRLVENSSGYKVAYIKNISTYS